MRLRNFSGRACAVIVAALLCAAGSAAAASHDYALDNARAKLAPKLLRELAQDKAALSAPRHDVLLRLAATADLSSAAKTTTRAARLHMVQRTLLETARGSRGAVVAELERLGLDFTAYYLGNTIVVRGATEAQIMALAARADVARVASDAPVRILPAPDRSWFDDGDIGPYGVEGGINRTGAPRVWSELSSQGAGIVVAGQDTGIEWTHPALQKHYRGYQEGAKAAHDYNWHDAIKQRVDDGTERKTANPCGYATRAPCDDHGHGTHTIGTVVGDDGRGNQVGMAPGAQWIGCRNMDAGTGKPSTYLECFQFFLAPWPIGGDPERDGKPEMAPHVINNSWGCPLDEGCDGDDFVPVLTALKAAGIMVVVSAGNDGSSCGTIKDAPAHHSGLAFRVGAIDHRSGNIASFSSRGPSKFDNLLGPDLAAPGVSIRSSVPGGGFASAMWSGTSMASPHVVGAVALLWSLDASYVGQIDRTIELFRRTAEPKTTSQSCGGVSGSSVPNNTYGYGNLDAYKAAAQRGG